MGARTWRDYSSSASATNSALLSLIEAERTRKALQLDEFRAAVTELPLSDPTPAEAPSTPSRERTDPRIARSSHGSDRLPWVRLPPAKKPWGPAMRQKLTRIALEKRGW